MKESKEMSYIERLELSIRIVLENIDYNNKNNLDNTYNYEVYEEITTEYDIYMNQC